MRHIHVNISVRTLDNRYAQSLKTLPRIPSRAGAFLFLLLQCSSPFAIVMLIDRNMSKKGVIWEGNGCAPHNLLKKWLRCQEELGPQGTVFSNCAISSIRVSSLIGMCNLYDMHKI